LVGTGVAIGVVVGEAGEEGGLVVGGGAAGAGDASSATSSFK